MSELGFLLGIMNNKNDKKKTNEIDLIAEQWVKLVLAHIEADKRQKTDDISERN